MRAHPIDHLETLTHVDARNTVWRVLGDDADYYWTEEVGAQLEIVGHAMLSAARAITATDRRGRALRAVAGRHGPVQAALLIPATAAACRAAVDRIEGCSGMFGEPLVRRAAEALLAVH